MIYTCTAKTNLEELIGTECWDGQKTAFHYGPLTQSKKFGEELVLENSDALSALMVAKIRTMLGIMIIHETSEEISPCDGFRLTFR